MDCVNHCVTVKIENGNVISFCTKCGAILSVKPANITEVSCNNNGGIILLD